MVKSKEIGREKMRKWTIFLIIVVALGALYFIGVSRVPDILAGNLSKKFGVPVSIDSMHFGLSDVEVEKVEIGNPQGYSLPKAFSAEKIDIDAPATEFFRQHISIDTIEVSDIYLGLEFDTKTSGQGNWTTIFSNFKERAHLEEEKDETIVIKRLVFKNIRTEILFRDGSGGAQKLPLIKEIVLTNISSQGGLPTDQLTGSVLGQMIKEVFIQQNMGNFLKDIFLDTPGKAVDSFFKPFKELFNTAKGQEEERSA